MIAYKQRVIDMDKLTMAHEYAMKHVQEGFDINYDVLVVEAWKYADAMQAEADTRKPKPELLSLQQTFIDGVEQPRYAPSLDEWQPDWSQAPGWANWWTMDENKNTRWIYSQLEQPYISDIFLRWRAVGMFDSADAPSFGYKGDWENSLRKRPRTAQ